MLYAVITSFGFITSLFIQTSVIGALDSPLSFLPLHFAIGCTILHRGRMELGALWLALTPLASIWTGFVIGSWWSYMAVAILGPILILRIFAKRSFLALLGLNWSLYLVFAFLNAVLVDRPVAMIIWGILFLTISIVFINGAQREAKRISKRFILTRHV